jgi:hypothetical protein
VRCIHTSSLFPDHQSMAGPSAPTRKSFVDGDWIMSKKFVWSILASLCMSAALTFLALPSTADEDDPPTRVARLAYAQGSVSLQPAGTDDWVIAGINRPMTIGDKIWADNDGRVELQLDGSFLRLANNTGLAFLNLSDNATQIQLTAGILLVRVRRLDENETYEIDTPNLAFSVMRPGLYRISVDDTGQSTFVTIRSGEGELTGGGAAYSIHANDSYAFSGTDQLYATRADDRGEDQFEAWSASQDRRWENSRSVHYVSDDVIGYQDLDDYGSWRQTADGNIWFPRVTVAGWVPYHYGHWDYIEPWGYTWVDDEPWGFAPFHYGRWVNYQGAWGWVPAPPRAERSAYTRPVYAPALVAWVGGEANAAIAWFPLGPREVYVPSYPVSRNYISRVNVTNTTVNSTVVNNYYNTIVVNRTTNVTEVNYVNRTVPGAVAATTSEAFTAAQPVAKNTVKVDQRTVASAPVRAVTPAVAPAKQAVLGTATATAKPPATVQTRTVVAKVAPPPPPPSFEKGQAAIKNKGGKPLSPAQMRKIEPAPAGPHPAVKIAPAAKPSAAPPPTQSNRANQPANAPPVKPAPSAMPPANRPVDRPPATNNPNTKPNQPPNANPAQPQNRPTDRPGPPNNPNAQPNQPPANTAQPNRPSERPETPNKVPQPPRSDRPPAKPPVHPNEQPPAPRPATPPSGNSALDKQRQLEQEQLRAKQEQERQKLQQQQQQEHARAAQQADQGKKQQMEQQYQQQTQQQQEKHAQEQKQLDQKQGQQKQQQKQEEQKQQPKKPDHPPQAQP